MKMVVRCACKGFADVLPTKGVCDLCEAFQAVSCSVELSEVAGVLSLEAFRSFAGSSLGLCYKNRCSGHRAGGFA